MKDILRRLLEAEEAGRQAATRLEATGEDILRQARATSAAIVGQVRAEAAQRVQELERQAGDQIERGRQAVEQETSTTLERLRAQAAPRRPEAVAQGVAILLGERDA